MTQKGSLHRCHQAGEYGVTAGELTNIISACIQHKMTAYEVSLFQMGIHPALSASTIAYHLVNAAELAVKTMQEEGGIYETQKRGTA